MNKRILAALMLIVAAGSFGIAGTMFSVPVADEQTSVGIEYTMQGLVTIYRIGPDGQYHITEQKPFHNLLTNAGRQIIINYLNGLTAQTSNVSLIALGNSTAPVVGDTLLAGDLSTTGCGLYNATAVVNQLNATARDISWQWTNGCTNQVVNTTAIFNNTAGGNTTVGGHIEFAGATLTSSTLQNTDKIQVNYTINIG